MLTLSREREHDKKKVGGVDGVARQEVVRSAR